MKPAFSFLSQQSNLVSDITEKQYLKSIVLEEQKKFVYVNTIQKFCAFSFFQNIRFFFPRLLIHKNFYIWIIFFVKQVREHFTFACQSEISISVFKLHTMQNYGTLGGFFFSNFKNLIKPKSNFKHS